MVRDGRSRDPSVVFDTHGTAAAFYAVGMAETMEMLTGTELHNRLPDVFQSMLDSAGAKLVFGDPVLVAGKTILPVATVRYGFGGGSGAKQDAQQQGGGGCGGLVAKPAGVVEVTATTTRFIPITSPWPIVAAIGIGLCIGMLAVSRRVVQVKVERKGKD